MAIACLFQPVSLLRAAEQDSVGNVNADEAADVLDEADALLEEFSWLEGSYAENGRSPALPSSPAANFDPLWTWSLSLSAGGGWASNPALREDPASSYFAMAGLDVYGLGFVSALDEVSILLFAESRYYVEDFVDDAEVIAFGQASWKRILGSFEGKAELELIYSRQFFDATDLLAPDQPAVQFLSQTAPQLTLTPRWTFAGAYFVEAISLGSYTFHDEAEEDYVSYGFGAAVGIDKGLLRRIRLYALTLQDDYLERRQRTTAGFEIPLTELLIHRYRAGVSARWPVALEGALSFSTNAWFERQIDNGPGYYDSSRVQVRAGADYDWRRWTFGLDASLLRIEYDLRRNFTLAEDGFSQFKWEAAARVEFEMWEDAELFGSLSWSTLDSDRSGEDYENFTAHAGLNMSF